MTIRRFVEAAMCGLLAWQGALDRSSRAEPVYAGTHQYAAFNEVQYQMDVWRGDHVSVLTPVPDRSRYEQQALFQLVDGLDGAFAYYFEATGRLPLVWDPTTLDGRDTVAAVADTCGAGCGYLGFNGIEILTPYFNTLHDGIRDRDEFDQVPFYELGRNFWHYDPQLVATSDPANFVTGYAVLMRFLSMEAAGVQGGPFGNWSFAEFRSRVEGLIDIYESNPAITFEDAFTNGVDISGSGLGGTDLFASLVLRLGDEYGEPFLLQLWKEVELRPDAVTNQDALDNFFLAASYSAERNLTTRFANAWRWPISDAARQEAEMIGVPGDYNGNGIVDAADYVVWRDGLGTTYTADHYNTWRSHFGQTAGSASTLNSSSNAAAPEPATGVMLLTAMLAIFFRRRGPEKVSGCVGVKPEEGSE